MYDNQRKRKMKKNILLALISLCFWGCSEDEIKPYIGEQYLYFSQLKRILKYRSTTILPVTKLQSRSV